MNVVDRHEQDARERRELAPSAALSSDAVRDRPGHPDPLRNEYQRDRDKIIHCKSFRRLSHKTQVFLAPMGDHYRTRLTHTLEVAQIARTISRALGLNEDLTEAVALGHDLGHTPFGHTGEWAIRECLAHELGVPRDDPGYDDLFRHNVQSLRVVEVVENEGRGLNLTEQVRDGIVSHTGRAKAQTLEGDVVSLADRIAYVNHDIDDAIRAGGLSEDELPASTHRVLGADHASRIQTLVLDTVRTTAKTGEVGMSLLVANAMEELRGFLLENVYRSEPVLREAAKAKHLLCDLFFHYLGHMDQVPQEYRRISGGDDLRAVTDYVAGMTDRYARNRYEALFVPNSFIGEKPL